VDHSGPGNRLAHTILAHPTVAEEEGYGTEQAIIVQGLDYRHTFGRGGVIASRGDEG
jgi:hypothetical protein